MPLARRTAPLTRKRLESVGEKRAEVTAGRKPELDEPVLERFGVAERDQMLPVRHGVDGEGRAVGRMLRMVDVGVALREELARLPWPVHGKAPNSHSVELLDGTLIAPAWHDCRYFDASLHQLTAKHPGGAPETAVLAPGEELDADQADLHARATAGRGEIEPPTLGAG